MFHKWLCVSNLWWCHKLELKESSMALLSTEAEYIAGAHAAKELIWIRSFLSEIEKKQDSPTLLLIDNQSMISLAKNPMFHSQTTLTSAITSLENRLKEILIQSTYPVTK